MQALPLNAKINMTRYRINQWVDEFGEDGVYISFSGGKDSTVLMDLVRNECGYKNIPAVFVDVPTQYMELREFAKTWDNLVIIKPKISFMQVCETYGFPLISKEVSKDVSTAKRFLQDPEKHANKKPLKINLDGKYKPCALVKLDGELTDGEGRKSMFNEKKWRFLVDAPFDISNECCNIMKKDPMHKYEKETGRVGMTAQMAQESRLRLAAWLKNGCNAFNAPHKISNPMSFWTEQDVLEYIKTRSLPICSVYGDIVEVPKDKKEADGQLKLWEERPKYKTTGCERTGCMLCGFGCHLEKPGEGRFETLKETHPKMYNLLDLCKNNGVTFREAIEWTNENGGTNIKL